MIIQNVYNNYSKSKNFRKDKIKFLTSNYRRHCINEVNNEFALHNCNDKLGKFLLTEEKGKIQFLICSNCKKVYYDTKILCKCYKCNKEYKIMKTNLYYQQHEIITIVNKSAKKK